MRKLNNKLKILKNELWEIFWIRKEYLRNNVGENKEDPKNRTRKLINTQKYDGIKVKFTSKSN